MNLGPQFVGTTMNATNVACPTCGAKKGMPCTDPYGYPMASYHQPRQDAAKRG